VADDALRKLRVIVFLHFCTSVLLLFCTFAFISPASARMYESPYSLEVIGVPNSDNEPPITTITIGTPQYQEGNDLYINSSTEITLSAVDYGIVPSGVNYTEYRIDSEASWTRYTNPFTLSTYSDSTHTITYRSIDNVSNTETEKTTTIILDKTPPETNISASEALIDGATNTVSPDTRFYLNSTDNISGVRVTQYRIDQGEWLDYLTGFTLSGAGTHTIGYKAKDNVENEETEVSITVRLIVLEISKNINTEPVVLAAAWLLDDNEEDDNEHHDGEGDNEHHDEDCNNEHHDGEDGNEHHDEDSDKEHHNGDCDNEHHDDDSDKTTALDNLMAILSSSGITYYIPQSNDDFKETFRSGRYNTYILIDFADNALIDELKEAINYGDGFVYIKTQSDDEHKISELFGVEFNGMSTNKDMEVNLTESEISSASILQSKGKAVKTTITSTTAQNWGYVNDKNETYPVIVYNQYGKGKAILFSFDLLNSEDQSKVSSLIINSINNVVPAEHNTRALANEPININIQNSTEPVDIKITETLPDNTTVDSISPSAAQSNNTIEWTLSLMGSESKKLSYNLNLPDTSGDYKTNTEVSYRNQGNYKLYGNHSLTLTIEHNSSELQSQINTDLNSLQAEGKDKDHINDAIEELNEINQNASNRKDAENNIEKITEAIEELKKVSINISDVRLKLDELLKIWEKKWYLMEE